MPSSYYDTYEKNNFVTRGHLGRYKSMAIYTININERTREGRELVNYLREPGVIQTKEDNGIDATRKAIKEMRDGKVTHCKDFDEYLKKVLPSGK